MIKENNAVAAWRKGISYVLVCAMIYVLIFGGLNIDDFLLGLGKVKHIGIIEKGEDYIIYENNDGSRTYEGRFEYEYETIYLYNPITKIQSNDHSYKSSVDNGEVYFSKIEQNGKPSFTMSLNDFSLNITPIIDGKNTTSVEVFSEEDEIQSLIYKDTYESGIDLEYISVGSGIKENIVLNKSTKIKSFNYYIDTMDGVPCLEDNVIVFRNDNNEELFYIDAPYMEDASGEISEDVTLSLDVEGDKYIMSVTPDENWINDNEREYPIKIDPRFDSDSPVNYLEASLTDGIEGCFLVGRSGGTMRVAKMKPVFEGDIIDQKVDINSAYVRFYSPEDTPLSSYGTYNYQDGYFYATRTGIGVKGQHSFNIINYLNHYKIFENGRYHEDRVDYFGFYPNGSNVPFKNWSKNFYRESNGRTYTCISINYTALGEIPAPTATPHSNGINSESGYIDLTWNAVSGATKYNVCFFNGDEYVTVDTVTNRSWSSKNKNIWPTAAQIAAGNYDLHPVGGSSSGGPLTQFANDLYKHVTSSDGVNYSNDPRYFIKIVPEDNVDYLSRPSLCAAAEVYLPDASYPFAPQTLSANGGAYTNANSIDITWSKIEDYNGTNFADMTDGTIEYSINSPNTWQTATSVDWANHKFNLDISNVGVFPDGIHTIYVRATDIAGNVNTIDNTSTSSAKIYIDRTGPVINSITLPTDWTNINPILVDYATTDTNGFQSLEYSLDSGSWQDAGATLASDNDLPITLPNTSPTFPDGEHTISFRATDNLGNIGDPTTDYTLKLDRTKPTISSFESDAMTWTNVVSRGHTITFTYSGIADDSSGVKEAVYAIQNSDGSWGSWSSPIDLTNPNFYVDSTGTDYADFTYGLKAIDNALNESDILTTKVMIDNISPTVNITSPIDGDSVNNLIEIWGTCKDDSIDTYTISMKRYDSSSTLLESADIANGNANIENSILATINASSYSDGDKIEFTATATDNAGNTTDQTVNVTVDKSLVPITNTMDITSPAKGGYADEQVEDILYSTTQPVTYMSTFIDGEFLRREAITTQPYIDTLLYDEQSVHDIMLVGEVVGGHLEFCEGVSKNPLLISTLEASDIAASNNVVNNNGISVVAGQSNGSFTMYPQAFANDDIAYKVEVSCDTPVDIEVSTDGGATYSSITADKYYLNKNYTDIIVRVALDGTDVAKGVEISTAKIQNPHNIKIQTVNKPTNLRLVSNTVGNIHIAWTDDSDPMVLYNVYRSTKAGFMPSLTTQVVTQSADAYYKDTNVAEGIKYYYKVIATKTFPVTTPYISFRESKSEEIEVEAYTQPEEVIVAESTYEYSGDDGADTVWGDPVEIAKAEQVNKIYGSNWTINGTAPAPTGQFEVNQSLLNGRAYCSIGFEPINFVSGNFFIKQNDASYVSSLGINSNTLRTYNTQTTEKNGPFGNGWAWHYSTHLKLYSDGHIGMTTDDGHLAMFRMISEGIYADDEDEQMSLVRTDTEHIVTTQYGEIYTFGSGGRLKSYTAANGNKADVVYHENGLIDKIVHEDGSELKLILDNKGHITNIYLPTGEILSYEYDGNDMVKFTDEAGQTTQYVYDDKGRMTEWYDKNGTRQVYNVYDDSDRVIEQWDANGGYYNLEYGDDYTFTTDANGNKNEYYYDSLGRTTKIVDSKGNSQLFEYNMDSQVTKYTDQQGKSISYDYDLAGNLIKETTNDNRVCEYQYDGNNNLTAEKDYNGNWTQYLYDEDNNMIEKVFPDGSTYKYSYTSDSQLRKIVDPLGNVDKYQYDGNNMISHTDANGNTSKYGYDDKDNLVEIRDALGNITQMEYNDKGNITKTILPDNTYMTYEYDNMDNMVVFYDAKNQATCFEYNGLGKVLKTTNPDGSIITYEYDYNQNLIKTNYPDGTYTVNTYDGNNNLVSTVDQDGRKVAMQYNAVNDITGIVSPNDATSELFYNTNSGLMYKTVDKGIETEYHYDSNENVTKLVFADGTTTTYEYDNMNRMVSETLNNGAVTRYTYNAIGLVDTVIDPMGNETKYIYDKIGQLTKIIDSMGNTIRYRYDALGNMVEMTDALGNSVEYSYDAVSQLQRIITPLGSTESYNYDPNGQLESIINALGANSSNTYDEMGRVITSTDLLGNTTTYEYDIAGNMIKQTNAANNTFTYEYDSNGNVIKITDPLGSEASYTYDVMNNVTEVNGEEGYKEEYTYDEYGRLVSSIDSEGYTKSYEYDEMGRLSKEYDNTDKSVSYTYNTVGKVNSITNGENESTLIYYDLNGNTTQVLYADGTSEYYHYNALNQLIRQYDRVGLETLYEYDSVGNVTYVKQPSNKVYRYEYDRDGNLTKETNPEGGVTRYTYDAAYNVVSVTDPMGNTTTMEYNSASMLTKVIDPMENISVAVEYSILGEVLSETDALGNITTYAYDAISRLTGVTDPLGRTTNYTYDRADNIVAVLDGNGNTTNYEYNTMGLLTKEIDPLGNTESYEYMVDGLIEEITKADGTSSTYSYDKAGRMLDIIYSDGTKIGYGYNDVGSVTIMTDSLGTSTYQYDDMQRLISTTDVNDKTVSYEYDILGRKTAQVLPDGQRTEYTYDVMDRLTQVYQNDALLAEYEYNKNSQLTENNRNKLHTSYEYDALGQLTEMTTVKGYEDIMNFEYEYDKIGNIVSEVRTEGNKTNDRTYVYDGANQLTTFTDNDYTESYSYDNAGNMLEKSINGTATSYSYNSANQLLSELTNSTEISYDYDVNGDLISKSTGEQYSYDIQGNLTSIVGNGINQSFTYNGNGHRMSKTDDGETIYYVNDINLPFEQVLQTYNDSGIIDTFTYGVERIQSIGETNETYLYDGRGSVVGAINQDNILESYSYTAYGELMPSSPAPKVWGYNGEATDGKTGLQYLRARYYDTNISRFFQEDDVRGDFTEPQTMKRYIYVGNNPVNLVDPSGYGWRKNRWSNARYRIKSSYGRIKKTVRKKVKKAKKYAKKKIVGAITALYIAAVAVTVVAVTAVTAYSAYRSIARTRARDRTTSNATSNLLSRLKRKVAIRAAIMTMAVLTANNIVKSVTTPEQKARKKWLEEQSNKGSDVIGGTEPGEALDDPATFNPSNPEAESASNASDVFGTGCEKTEPIDDIKINDGSDDEPIDDVFGQNPQIIEGIEAGTLSDKETREWYKDHINGIENELDSSLSLEEQARQASELRNKYRNQARDLMKDREKAEELNSTDPNKTWEEVVEKYKSRGLEGDALWEEIINATSRSRKSVDKKYGVE